MSSEWFCKIGEKKVGPLNAQQLKTIVAKGQLKPEHLVRRGSEGPWVAAGRIKGLFAAGDAKSPKEKPVPSGKPLPQAAASAAPPATGESPPVAGSPAVDIPQELSLGQQHKHHVKMNVDKFDIETTPVMLSRRKSKRGLETMKKSDQKKLKTILFSVIGGGMAFALIVFFFAFINRAPDQKPSDSGAARWRTLPAIAAQRRSPRRSLPSKRPPVPRGRPPGGKFPSRPRNWATWD